MVKRAKMRMPKNRAEFEQTLINTFMAGCTHAYGVEHTIDIYGQEMLGALLWVGRITEEEYNKKMVDLRGF